MSGDQSSWKRRITRIFFILGGGDFVESVLKEAGELPELHISSEEIMRQVCEITGVSKERGDYRRW